MPSSSMTFVKEILTVFQINSQCTDKARIEYSSSQYEDNNNMLVARSNG